MSTRVYVGGVSHRARERDIEKFFRKCGRIREIAIKNGFCFVEFDDYRDADDACYELNGKELIGERVTVEIARGTPHGRDKDRWGVGGGRRSPPRGGKQFSRDSRGRPVWLDKYGPPTRTDYRLIIENLSSRVSWQDLKDYMRQAGDVTYADAHKTKRNEGSVEFGNYADMKAALEKLDGTELNGRRIRLYEEKRRSRSRSRSRSNGRSRSRSRSRSKSAGRRSSGRRSRSPARRSRSPTRRSRSPIRRSRSPARRSRSPDNYARSPTRRSRSRSARDYSRSPVRRSRSPDHRRSRSRSADRRSRSRSDDRMRVENNGVGDKRSSRSHSRDRDVRSSSLEVKDKYDRSDDEKTRKDIYEDY